MFRPANAECKILHSQQTLNRYACLLVEIIYQHGKLLTGSEEINPENVLDFGSQGY